MSHKVSQSKLIGIIICLNFIVLFIALLISFKKNEGFKQENLRQRSVIEEYQNRQFKMEEAILTLIKFDKMNIDKNTLITNEEGDSISIKELLGTSQGKLIIKISKENCMNCILSFCSVLFDKSRSINKKDIIFIADFNKKEELDFYKRVLNIDANIYTVKELNLPIEQEDIFYVFVLNADLSIQKLFTPLYDYDFLSEEYIKLIEKCLGTNINN